MIKNLIEINFKKKCQKGDNNTTNSNNFTQNSQTNQNKK
jgi:hypothetical protein